MRRVVLSNKAWFRAPAWFVENMEEEGSSECHHTILGPTATGQRAPATPLWKVDFTVWMMVLNTIFQIILSFFMWHYNRFTRPSWATGTFVGLGCGVAMLAGLMSWWEGRKVKKTEGIQVRIMTPEMIHDEKMTVQVSTKRCSV